MKKHLIAILIILLVLSLVGVSVWFFVFNRNVKPLYKANCEFVLSQDTESLKTKIAKAETLYNESVSSETRLTTLSEIIDKLDTFESDLNSYLVLCNAKPKSTKKLSKSYTELIKSRSTLINEYDEYIARMSGNLNADGSAVENLYNDIFNKTVSYIYKYNSCFNQTSNYVFTKVYTVGTIKPELYSWYSLSVNNLLNNIVNNQFTKTVLVTKLNSAITLTDGNLNIKETVIGGEFNEMALKFKLHYNNCDTSVLIDNFISYYNLNVNVDIETSNEKLAVHYAKQILEI